MKLASLFLLSALLILISCNSSVEISEDVNVAIQPYDDISTQSAKEVKQSLEELYGVTVQIKNVIPIPEKAFVNIKSPRYRADTIIWLLKHDPLYADADYVMALTNEDISNTKYSDRKNKIIKSPKKKYKDWGIFGLGYRPGKSSVVSTHRLHKGVSKEQFIMRLKKISCHELGHNLGLPHCPNKSCIMQDAAETIKTIDNVQMHLCTDCRKKIGMEDIKATKPK